MPSISKATALLIYLLPFQKLLSHLVAVGFPSAKNLIFVAFEFGWVALFILFPFGSIAKRYWPICVFILITLLISIGNIVTSSDQVNDILGYLSGFRRLAIPFISFFIFYRLSQKENGLIDLNRALVNLYWIVLTLQLIDFAAMQVIDTYRNAIISLANIADEVAPGPLYSHTLFFVEYHPIRSFGVLLNFHGSGLLLILLFLYKLYLKGTPKAGEIAIMALGVIAGGSLQTLGLLLFLPILLLGAQHFVRHLIVIGLITFFWIAVPFFSSNPLPYFGNIYMFEYIIEMVNVLLSMLSDPRYFSEIIFGFGNLRLSSGSWETTGFGLELGDIGFFRLSLESGLLVFLFWMLLCIRLGNYKSNKNKTGDLQHHALFAIPFIGILSLLHYPVLFLPINISIYMLSLALISGLRAGRGLPFRKLNKTITTIPSL